MITREEFESGVEFKDSFNLTYKFMPSDVGDPWISTYSGSHVCNVSKITKTYFTFYVHVLGHSIDKKVHFKNLTKL